MAREKFILMSELTEEQKAKNFLCWKIQFVK